MSLASCSCVCSSMLQLLRRSRKSGGNNCAAHLLCRSWLLAFVLQLFLLSTSFSLIYPVQFHNDQMRTFCTKADSGIAVKINICCRPTPHLSISPLTRSYFPPFLSLHVIYQLQSLLYLDYLDGDPLLVLVPLPSSSILIGECRLTCIFVEKVAFYITRVRSRSLPKIRMGSVSL